MPLNLNDYFTKDKPVIFNFHGYPETVKQMIFDYKDGNGRFSIYGYIENGSTTTPFDMQIRNHTSRWHLAMEAFRLMAGRGVLGKDKAEALIKKYERKLSEHKEYIIKNGVDPDEIEKWDWSR